MIDGPSSPGVGEPVYQPATAPLVGTCSIPFDTKPSLIIEESTPIEGIVIFIGADDVR